MQWTYWMLFLLFTTSGIGQTLDASRAVDWTLAGLRNASTSPFLVVDMEAQGVDANGILPNDEMVANTIAASTASAVVLIFPAGNFLFNKTISLPSNVVIMGQGAEQTTFTLDLGGTGHGISAVGEAVNSDIAALTTAASKEDDFVFVDEAMIFSIGDWVRIIQEDADLVTSTWAEHTVGQIVQIKNISDNKITFESPLRMDYDSNRSPYLLKIIPVENVGIVCLKLLRIDNTAPEQSSNINFSYAVNSWVTGIESENCTFSHIQARQSSNLHFSKSYFHHAFGYGGGGRAYGIMVHATSNECLIENNIFEHLRHSMILQSGANGNVFAYNYSFDPFWESSQTDAAGDLVLHGNYPYANLFEQNIAQNIVIDNSHGPNGPFNTIFRNRGEGFGIFFSETNSPNQNIIGNEITNLESPYSLVNYTLKGTGHFVHGNNNKGTIHPEGTEALADVSYAYSMPPEFITATQWAGIGTPNAVGSGSISGKVRYEAGAIFSDVCGNSPVAIRAPLAPKESLRVYPNPMQSEFIISASESIQNLSIVNIVGQQIYSQKNVSSTVQINTANWENGLYVLLVNFEDGSFESKVVLKRS